MPQDRVQGPAIGLMVTAIIGMVMQVVSMLVNILGVSLGGLSDLQRSGGGEAALSMLSGGIGIVFSIIGIIIGVIILMGSMKMKRLESYGFAMAATILAMIPCISPCCLLGLPIGIWALVVLLDQNVKTAFTS